MAQSHAEFVDQVQKLLREGKTQEADDLIAAHKEQLAAMPEPGAAPAPPRSDKEIVNDFLVELVHHLGSPPALVTLLVELEAVLAKL